MSKTDPRACCCNSPVPPSPSCRYPGIEEVGGDQNPPYGPDVGKKSPPYGGGQVDDGHPPIDPQTLNTISSFRKKARQFLKSESESSGSAPDHQCQNVNEYRGSNVLRQANDLIDYVPQSQFLRKMKQQCQYLQNNQPNIFSTLDNCEEFSPQGCQMCIDKTKYILSVGDQIKCTKYKSPSQGSHQTFPFNNQVGGINNLEGNQIYPRDPQHFCQMNSLNNNQRLPRESRILPKGNLEGIPEEINEKILEKSSECKKKAGRRGKKSEHVSRSKKPTKSRGRRKRKSGSSDKGESGDGFEPNLKKPHENSCERCWRYASPSRSPVNKPDQRYDPNFRRGHSCMDFNQERGDGDLQVAGKHISPCKNLQPITSREKMPSSSQAQSQRQQPEVNQQKTHFSPHKTQFSSQEAHFKQQGAQRSPQEAPYGPQTSPYGPQASPYNPQASPYGPQAAPYGPQAVQYSPQPVQYCPQTAPSGPPAQFTPQKTQCLHQHLQNQIKPDQHLQNASFTKVKESTYNYSRSKFPDKSPPELQPCEGGQKPPTSPGILQPETTRKPRPKSYTAGAPVLDPGNIPDYLLNATDYCDVCIKTKQGSDQVEKIKKNVKLSGNKVERPVEESSISRPAAAGTPLKASTPGMSNKSGPSPKSSSTPEKTNKSKTPSSTDQCKVQHSSPSAPKPKEKSPRTKSPKTPTSLNLNKPGTPGSTSTVYAEVVVKNYDNPCTPSKSEGQPQLNNKKSPSPKTNTKNGNSPGKGLEKGSPKRVQSSANCIENLAAIQEVRPQTAYRLPTEHDIYPGLRGINDPCWGTHPIRDCWCPPRAPFLKGNICNNPNPDQIFCCHCNWEENRRNEQQRIRVPPPSPEANVARNNRPKPPSNEADGRQPANDQNYASPASSHVPSEKYFMESVYPQVEDLRVKCPYRAFQRERRAANDTSWEEDYQRLKEFCYKHPEEIQYQVTTKTKNPFKNSEYQPTKYALFYMTENKQNKGNDVEVLVEELTQACPKNDSRTKDIVDKMKRIMEFPSDSMALRFQKGVSESCKTPRSSRILYF